MLLNAYDRLKVTETWEEAVPPEVFKVGFEIFKSGFQVLYIILDGRIYEIYNGIPPLLHYYIVISLYSQLEA